MQWSPMGAHAVAKWALAYLIDVSITRSIAWTQIEVVFHSVFYRGARRCGGGPTQGAGQKRAPRYGKSPFCFAQNSCEPWPVPPVMLLDSVCAPSLQWIREPGWGWCALVTCLCSLLQVVAPRYSDYAEGWETGVRRTYSVMGQVSCAALAGLEHPVPLQHRPHVSLLASATPVGCSSHGPSWPPCLVPEAACFVVAGPGGGLLPRLPPRGGLRLCGRPLLPRGSRQHLRRLKTGDAARTRESLHSSDVASGVNSHTAC